MYRDCERKLYWSSQHKIRRKKDRINQLKDGITNLQSYKFNNANLEKSLQLAMTLAISASKQCQHLQKYWNDNVMFPSKF